MVGGQLLARRPSLVLIFGSNKSLVSDSFIFLFWTYSQIVRSGRQGHECSVCGARVGAAINKDKVVPVAGASVESRLPDARVPDLPCIFLPSRYSWIAHQLHIGTHIITFAAEVRF